MKHLLLTLGLLAALALAAVAAEKTKDKDKEKSAPKKLRHCVSFKFKSEAGKEQIQKVVDAFKDLKKKIPTIEKFEFGVNVSPEKHDKGFTHTFMLTFASEKDRDDYAVHPDHKAFGALLKPVLDDVFVLDYWALH